MWVILPFFFINVYRVYGMKALVKAIVVFSMAGAVVIIPFAVRSPGIFLSGVFGHWVAQRFVATANISYLISRLVGWDHLPLVQAIALVVLFLIGLARANTDAGFYKFSSAALMLFILLNTFIDAYFYLIVFLLLIMFALMPAGRDRGRGTAG